MYTTIEKLYPTLPAQASIIPYKDWVIVAQPTYKGISIDIYEFIDELECFDAYEARMQKSQTSEEVFEDQGRGIQWAFEQLQ